LNLESGALNYEIRRNEQLVKDRDGRQHRTFSIVLLRVMSLGSLDEFTSRLRRASPVEPDEQSHRRERSCR
jgi:hypothetical protein